MCLRYGFPQPLISTLSNTNDFCSDIPAHTYQATFEPNKEWSKFYAPAPEIHQYWKRVATKYGCLKYIKLKQQVCGAVWDDDHSKWVVQVRSPPISDKKVAG